MNTDNTAVHKLRPIGGPWSFFNRMRIVAIGQILENSDTYNRVHELLNIFTTKDSRINYYAEGVGNYWDDKADASHVNADW